MLACVFLLLLIVFSCLCLVTVAWNFGSNLHLHFCVRISGTPLPKRLVRAGSHWWRRKCWIKSCTIYPNSTNLTKTCWKSWRREWHTGNTHTIWKLIVLQMSFTSFLCWSTVHVLWLAAESSNKEDWTFCFWESLTPTGLIIRGWLISLFRRVRIWRCIPPTYESLTVTWLCWTNSVAKILLLQALFVSLR